MSLQQQDSLDAAVPGGIWVSDPFISVGPSPCLPLVAPLVAPAGFNRMVTWLGYVSGRVFRSQLDGLIPPTTTEAR